MSTQKSDKTSEFYDNLMLGKEKRGVLGKNKRFSSDKIINKNLVNQYFTNVIKDYLNEEDEVLDYGCGPGAFLVLASSFCKNMIGVDISNSFVDECNNTINRYNVKNAQSKHIKPCNTGFEDNSFDKIIMVDVIHHLENISDELKEIHRILKPNGQLIVFEPNKLNPLMFIWHLIDKNERGLLRVGSPRAYRMQLIPLFKNLNIKYSGLVIGPDSWVFGLITNILNSKIIYTIFGWLNPKIFIVATKK